VALKSGDRIGPYEVLAPLGQGGMGEVYRARDTKLDRDVALKLLPESVVGDRDRELRFEREAKTLAALNHPNIAHVYDAGTDPAGTYLVMELVEGEDLTAQIARGPMPVADLLPIARQLIDALEAAHESGIIHRDLKPANIKLRADGTVKVLDFGLAKVVQGDGSASEDPSPSNSPTLTARATQMGMILGTAAYMAPEQARGRAVDRRADIWAFGVVLYEMLAGKRPFEGSDVSEVMARVIDREPDWAAVPDSTPASVDRLLRRCLVKDPRRRLAAIADARLELDEATTVATDVVTASSRSPRLFVAIIGVLATALTVATFGWIRAARNTPPVTRAAYVAATLGVGQTNLYTMTDRFAVSRDGSMLVLVDPPRGGLLLRHTSGLSATPITGAPLDASAPVFSPDGTWIAFRSGAELMKIPTAGGTPTVLVSGSSDYFINLTWSDDDRIRYPSLRNDAIRSVSASGGPVETISFGEKAYVTRAVPLPHERLLVSILTDGKSRIAVREQDGALRTLLEGWDGRLTPTGHLLFSRQEGTSWSIVAAPFDPDRAEVTGEATVMAQDVPVRYATPAGADAAGDLFYVGGPRSDRRVVLLDRAGAERGLPAPPGVWTQAVISPDGRHLALTRFEGARRTLWTLTLDSGALTQVTYQDDTFSPQWSPDGRRLVFSSFPIDTASRSSSIWSVLTDGRGIVEAVRAQWDAYPGGFSADGRVLYYEASGSSFSDDDVLSVTVDDASSEPTVLLATPASENEPKPSPNGRWLAYRTDASGTYETRVAPLADLARSVQVSTRGGQPIRWSLDGTKLYYTDGDAIASVEVASSGPTLSTRHVVFPLPPDSRDYSRAGAIDVMPDGNHAVAISGGLIYSDIIVLQHALDTVR